ncbi:MAG: hypothetical protein RR312_06460, partial [Bacteroidales bacterium]
NATKNIAVAFILNSVFVVTKFADYTVEHNTNLLKKEIYAVGNVYGISHITIEFEKPNSECIYINGCI